MGTIGLEHGIACCSNTARKPTAKHTSKHNQQTCCPCVCSRLQCLVYSNVRYSRQDHFVNAHVCRLLYSRCVYSCDDMGLTACSTCTQPQRCLCMHTWLSAQMPGPCLYPLHGRMQWPCAYHTPACRVTHGSVGGLLQQTDGPIVNKIIKMWGIIYCEILLDIVKDWAKILRMLQTLAVCLI